MKQGDSEFGCSAFGHLASPFVDKELPKDEMERFRVHLDACRPCRQVVASFRAIDVLASAPAPAVTEASWDRAWTGVKAAIAADREARASAPLASVARLSDRLGLSHAGGRRKWVAPLGYAAAAALIVALTLGLQGLWDTPTRPLPIPSVPRGPVVAAAPTAPVATTAQADASSITCPADDYIPVVYTTDDEDPMMVVQCTWVGEEI